MSLVMVRRTRVLGQLSKIQMKFRSWFDYQQREEKIQMEGSAFTH